MNYIYAVIPVYLLWRTSWLLRAVIIIIVISTYLLLQQVKFWILMQLGLNF